MATLCLKIGALALNSLTAHASKGFEIQYKKEVGGHLLGYRTKNGFYVSRAIPYNTPYSTRTGWGSNQYYFRRKGLLLETKKLKWIGAYHSHVEIKRSASTGQSREDKEAHIFSDRPVEIIIRITNYKMNSPRICMSYSEVRNSHVYFFDVCGFVKDPEEKITMMRVEQSTRK